MKAELKNLYPESTAVLEPKDDCMICLMALRTGMEKEGGSRPQRHQIKFLLKNLFASNDAKNSD